MLGVPAFILVALVFWSFGDRLSRWARLRTESAAGRFAFSSALSYGALTLLMFVLAVFRLVSFASCLGLLAAMAALSLPDLRANVMQLLQAIRQTAWKRLLWPGRDWEAWAVWLSGAIVVLGALQALAPVTGMDAGRMHFAAPKIMLGEHGLSARPEVWFHRTGGFYLVYLFGFALQGEALAKLLSFGVSPLALLLAASASHRLAPGSGRKAAAAVALTPLFTGFTGYEYLELPILMYVLAAFLAFHRYRTEGGWGWAIAAATLSGFALGVKITAFPVLVFIIPLVLEAVRREGRKAALPILLGALGFSIAAGFWPIWNRLTIGSFVHHDYLNVSWTDTPKAGLESRWIAGIFFALGSLATTSEYWIDSAGPFVLASLFGVVFFRVPKEYRLPSLLIAGAVTFYLAVLAIQMPFYLWIDGHARYLGPFLLGFGALAAGPFLAWVEPRSRLLRACLIVGLLLPAAPLLALKAGKAAVAAPAAFGLESRSHYLAKKIETFEACEILNKLPDPDVKVLFIAQRPYYLDRPMMPEQFWLGLGNREDLLLRIRKLGTTHVLVEPDAWGDWFGQQSEAVFGSAPFREIGRWPWKQNRWVRLYVVEKP